MYCSCPSDLTASCSVWKDWKFRGQRKDLGAGEQINALGSDWNDEISSTRARPGCVLKVHWDHKFTGKERKLEGDAWQLADWNDRISSMSCDCEFN